MRPHASHFAFLILLLCVAVSAGWSSDSRAAWVPDGLPVSGAGSNFLPRIISDGLGGSFITWHGGTNSDIFARRLQSDGSPAQGWPASGPLSVCAAAGLQQNPVLVSDLAGGALIFWEDARSGIDFDIYAQHVTSAGRVAWQSEVPIANSTTNDYQPEAVSDGAGGAIVTWYDRRNQTDYDIYAQRIDGNGNALWDAGGTPICLAPDNQIEPVIVADGAGGAFIAWQDFRSSNDFDIFVQHIRANGTLYPSDRWSADGMGVCVAPGAQANLALAADGTGGVYVAWEDCRSGSDTHIFAQHLDATGAVVTSWPFDGRPVCQAQHSQYAPALASDGSNGAFIAWYDYRSGTSNDVYAQRLSASGVSWTGDGLPISTAANNQTAPQVSPDGRGGAFITWYDSRGGATNDIYVQQVNGAGTKNSSWDRDGLPVCLAPNTQQFPEVVTSSAGTAIVTWQDLRSGDVSTGAIYAQQTQGTATAGVGAPPAPVARVSLAGPNPFRASARIQLSLPSPAFVRAEVMDISGRRVATLASMTFAAGEHSLAWDGTNSRGGLSAPGVYLIRVQWPGFEKTQRVVRLP
jgi:hypothetical protein